MSKRYTNEEVREALDLIKSGHKITEVSKITGIPKGTLYPWSMNRAKNAHRTYRETIHVSMKVVSKVKELYLGKGMSRREVAQELGVPFNHIQHILYTQRITKRNTRKQSITTDDIKTVRSWYLEKGYSSQKIANKSEMPFGRVRYILEKFGIKRTD